jgi:hypothetical protein
MLFWFTENPHAPDRPLKSEHTHDVMLPRQLSEVKTSRATTGMNIELISAFLEYYVLNILRPASDGFLLVLLFDSECGSDMILPIITYSRS